MALEVLEVSGLVTIQDAGRVGWRKFGVPASGPMDVFASRAANALAGNPPECAVLEIGAGEASFKARQDCVIAVAGMGYKLSVYIWEFPLWSSFFVRGGWKVSLSKTEGGMWAYLAVSGGVQTPPVLGSRSTYLRGGFGGLEGRQLQAGDILKPGRLSRLSYELAARTVSEEARPGYRANATIDVVMGPQIEYFSDESIKVFLSSEYLISLTSDRMGYRLDGSALPPRTSTELISEGMTSGAIQVPAGGQPIVMMADSPTTGGYPKIGVIAAADMPLLAQAEPNKSRIRFQETTLERAQEKYRQLMNGLYSSILEAD